MRKCFDFFTFCYCSLDFARLVSFLSFCSVGLFVGLILLIGKEDCFASVFRLIVLP